ncbi:YraN family protein [Polyangium mundeleinium]|uniref:DUF6531 domain-containing protein n=1 Tax=Polyangium mundeleinium TaxID=2995306 RepID=A0ABT5EIY9_9BACT|nr:YraN family protein [Polyangium mundeleinium]MDC0740907.1 DUF6531 domain-containing protein [Polyangium mundeleinium]
MPAAAKWGDLVLGIDIHMVVVPGSPNPWPLPHPFIGIVFDPLGAALSAVLGGGPVLVNGMPAATVATDVLGLSHAPMPPGTTFAPNDVPDNAGTFVTGSKTVYFGGLSAGRAGSLVSSCNFPINVPTSSCIAPPSGPPVDVGGPDAFDATALIMRGMRTKWFSNKIHSAFRIKPRSRMSKLVCFLTGHPVDVMTGEVLTDAVDFELPGPLPFVFERNYYSGDETAGALGPAWHHPLEASVDESPLRGHRLSLDVRLPDGRVARHLDLAVGASEWRDQDRYTLARDEAGYTLTFWDGTSYRFEPAEGATVTHPLAKISDRCGNAITLRYRDGRLHDGTDSAGRHLRFVMRGSRLVAVRVRRPESGGDTWHTLVRYSYNEEGYLVAAEDAAGHSFRYAYKGGVLIQETNRNGLSFYFEYDWYAPGGYCVHTWGDGKIYERKITYHKEQFATVVEDGRGGRTAYFGNGDGLVEREIDPMGVERRYEWGDGFRKVAEIDGLGRRTEWAYDARGNRTVERDALGHETRWAYNALNLPVEMVDATGAAWRWAYDHRGKLVREVDPIGGESRFKYDRRGLLLSVEDPLGRNVQLEHDGQGNCIAVMTPGGAVSRYEFDDLGRVIKAVDARGVQVRLEHDVCGRVVRVERSDGAFIRVKRDAEGNVIEREDEARRVWRYAYRGINKLEKQVDPEGGIVQISYDSDEALVALTNERGEVYRYERDRAGRVVKEVGFDGRTLACLYDRVGHTKRVTTGGGKHISLERDALGRLIKLRMPGPILPGAVLPSVQEFEFAYDARGELVRARNAASDVTFVRDALGRVVEERAGDVIVESRYNAAGERVLLRTSLGHEAHFGFDQWGTLEQVSFGHSQRFGDFTPESLREGGPRVRAPWKSAITRDRVGDEVARQLPGEVTSHWDWDHVGRPAVRTMEAPEVALELGYRWKSDEELEALVMGKGREVVFGHDRRGHLIWSVMPGGRTEHQPVDTVGNVYRSEGRSDRQYGAGGRVEEANGVRYVHDADGQLVEKVLPDGARWRYAWDVLGQLVDVVRPDGAKISFAYDALGRRVRKDSPGKTTRYLWDGDDLIHEITEGAPLETWLWEPGSLSPVAKAAGDERFAVIADHRGVPLIVVDEEGKTAWLGGISPLGEAWIQVAETACPWRFAGQYGDEETGLYYNRFRYFDPGLGRYISQDPIGPEGGLGLYNYVPEPWAWIDPLGLACKNHQTGKRGERIARNYLQKLGFNILGSVRNKSGHGIDIVARDAAGMLRFFEVKTTEGLYAAGLAGAQKNGATQFVWSRLARAAQGRRFWQATSDPQTQSKALSLMQEIQNSGGSGSIKGEVLRVVLGNGTITRSPW